MAISRDSVVNQGADNTSTKPAGKSVSEADKNKAEAVASIDSDKEWGQRSKDIGVINDLVDPSDKDVTYIKTDKTEKDESGVEKPVRETHTKGRTVGYRVKNTGSEPIEFSEFGLPEGYRVKDNRLGHGDEETKSTLKPGETADLTIYETALLLSQPEFDARAEGGDQVVTASYTHNRKTDGTESKNGSNHTFRLGVEGGTSRDIPPVEILTYDEEEGANGNKVARNKQIKPEFKPKFDQIAASRRRRGRSTSASTTSTKNQRNEGAAAFWQMHKKNAAKGKK